MTWLLLLALAQDIDGLKHRVEEVRGLKFKEEVPVKEADAAKLKEVSERITQELYPGDTLKQLTRMVLLLSMQGPAFSDQAFDKDFAEAQNRAQKTGIMPFVGFYDIDHRICYVGKTVLNPDERFVVAHELTHAIQDQHLDLRKYLKMDAAANLDAALGRFAVGEGEATVVGLLASRPSNTKEDIARVGDGLILLANKNEPMFRLSAYSAMNSVTLLTYFLGGSLIARAVAKDGWEAADKIWKNPPESSEQILHPEKYFDTVDHPVRVTLPDSLEGWTMIRQTTLGEFVLRSAFLPILDDRDLAEMTIGWGGDRVALLGKGDSVALVLASRWDSKEDAQEFARNFAKSMALSHKKLTVGQAWNGEKFAAETGEGAARLRVTDADVFLAIGPASEIQKLADYAGQAKFQGEISEKSSALSRKIQIEALKKIDAEAAAQDFKIDGNKYEHKKVGIRIEKPDGWTFSTKTPYAGVLVMIQHPTGDLINVIAADSGGQPLQTLAEASKKQLEAMKATAGNLEDTKLAGQDAKTVGYELNIGAGLIHGRQYYFLHGKKLIAITVTDVGDVDDHKEEFKKMLESFQVFDPE